MVDLEAVEVVGVALEPHEESTVGDVGGEAAGGLAGAVVLALDAVDLAVHDVLEAVGAGVLAAVDGVPLAWRNEMCLTLRKIILSSNCFRLGSPRSLSSPRNSRVRGNFVEQWRSYYR